MFKSLFAFSEKMPETIPSTDRALDHSNPLQIFSKPQQQKLHDHSRINQAIKILTLYKDAEMIVSLIRQSQQYQPTWYFPTGITKLLAIRRCGLSSRDDLFCFLLNPNLTQPDTTLLAIKQRFLKTFSALCHGEIFQRKLNFESHQTSTLQPYRTKMGELFMQHFPKEVHNIEQQAKNHWVNQRASRSRRCTFTY